MKLIEEYMTPFVLSLPEDTTVPEAVQVMREQGIGAVVVNDSQNIPCGIFTERDLLMKVDLSCPEKLPSVPVREIMTKNLITVSRKQQYKDVIEMMQEYNIRHMPVVDGGQLVGMVSLRDLMQRYEENLQSMLSEKEQQLLANLKAISDSENRFRTIFNNSTVGILLFDHHERLVSWNPLAAGIAGMNDSELLRKPLKEFFHPRDVDRILSADFDSGKGDHSLETGMLDRDREYIDVALSLSRIKSEDGRPEGYLVIVRDIREQKAAREQIQRTRKELEDIKKGIDQHSIVATIDRQGKITSVNEKYCEISGYEREDLIGRDYTMLHAFGRAEDVRNIRKTVFHGQVWQGEIRNQRKDGTSYWVSVTVVPLLKENGRPYQFVSIQTDITQRKRYEEEMQIANRDLKLNAKLLQDMVADRDRINKKLKETQAQVIQVEKMATLGTLAAGFAHEVKNPLAVILQAVERIEKELKKREDDANLPYVDIVKGAAGQANKVVTSLLRYSRASHLDEERVDVMSVLQEAEELVKNNAMSVNVTFTTHFERSEEFVTGDPVMLLQAFFDLYMNAIDAMPGGGEIVVETARKTCGANTGPVLEVRVRDHGVGIAESQIGKIFDPFYTTKEGGVGRGLGLSTVYLILERHQGTIHVQSRLGEGTVFTICLPLCRETERSQDHV